MVRDFQTVLGREAREQILAREGRLPDACFACVGGGSNAIGLFHPFLNDAVRLIGAEAAGEGLESGRHAAPLAAGRPGVLHGAYSFLLQDADGQVIPAHSVSAGLDYPGVGPEHAYLRSIGRAEYVPIRDDEALEACRTLALLEGILPALETAHALAALEKMGPGIGRDAVVVVSLSGRGDKDMPVLSRLLDPEATT
jgi:tryptophan synthase beta chain